jgi:hypothetical protein
VWRGTNARLVDVALPVFEPRTSKTLSIFAEFRQLLLRQRLELLRDGTPSSICPIVVHPNARQCTGKLNT